ncbi:MAG: hypothetical protein ACI977_000155 [Candidatus Nanohaloarchaea archaeon]|jgi:hypothetical protein
MSLYRLWAGKVIEENPKRYFEADADFILKVSEDIDLETGEIKKNKKEALQSFNSEDEEISPDAKKLISAVFIGDTEWYQLLEEWLSFPIDKIFFLMDSNNHKLGKDTAKEYGSLKNLDYPDYSRPEDLKIDDKKPTEHTNGIVDQYLLTVAILDLEWYFYAAKEAGIEISDEFAEKAREESLRYFTGKDGEMSEEVSHLQESLLLHAAEWCDELREDYRFRSTVLKKTSKILKEEAEKISSRNE